MLTEAVAKAPTLRLLWGDGRYSGPLVSTAATALGLRVQVVAKPSEQKGCAVLPHRWVVERTFAWLGTYRRLAGRDCETNPRTSETWIRSCMSNLMVRRLAKIKVFDPLN